MSEELENYCIIIAPDTLFEDFKEKVSAKVSKERLQLRFKDEDGGQLLLVDEIDYDLAMNTITDSAKGKSVGNLEIW